jgi:hypothetical protein
MYAALLVLILQIPLESVDVGSYDLMNVRRALAEKSNGKPPTPAQVQRCTLNLSTISCCVMLRTHQSPYRL